MYANKKRSRSVNEATIGRKSITFNQQVQLGSGAIVDGITVFMAPKLLIRKHFNYEIFIMNADGTNIRRLTNNSYIDTSPTWSPDGSKIMFTSNRDGNHELYTMDKNGNNITRLTNEPRTDNFSDWSPDGSKITFYSSRLNIYEGIFPGIFTMNFDGSELTLINANLHSATPRWSPDGSKIVMASGRQGSDEWIIYQIVTRDLNTNASMVLTDLSSYNTDPTWCNNGNEIVFFSSRD